MSPLCQRHQKWAATIAITTLCTQYAIFLMSQQQEKEKAHWNELEVRNMIDYLYEQQSQVGEGGNFKMTTYNGARVVDVVVQDKDLVVQVEDM
jgi:hypothetical protein